MSLASLGFPTHEKLETMGLNGRQFYDVTMYLLKDLRNKRRFGDGWLRRVHPLTGWQVMSFIYENSRRN